MAPTKAAPAKAKIVKAKKPSKVVTKDIGGDKNGGKRTVRVNRMVRTLHSQKSVDRKLQN